MVLFEEDTDRFVAKMQAAAAQAEAIAMQGWLDRKPVETASDLRGGDDAIYFEDRFKVFGPKSLQEEHKQGDVMSDSIDPPAPHTLGHSHASCASGGKSLGD